jgi:hypothetical protein
MTAGRGVWGLGGIASDGPPERGRETPSRLIKRKQTSPLPRPRRYIRGREQGAAKRLFLRIWEGYGLRAIPQAREAPADKGKAGLHVAIMLHGVADR